MLKRLEEGRLEWDGLSNEGEDGRLMAPGCESRLDESKVLGKKPDLSSLQLFM